MLKNILFILLLSVAVSQASIKELIPNLTAEDLEVQTQARLDLLAICSNAGRPDAEAERKAVSLEICEVLEGAQPVDTVVQPLLNNLERIGAAEAVPTLVKYLDYKNEHIRDDARRALSVNPSSAAEQALMARLKMRKIRNAKETAGLIYALGERKTIGASSLIAGALASPDDEIFVAAVKALGRLNEDAGIKALAERRSSAQGFRLIQINAALFSTHRNVVFEKLYAKSEPAEVRSVALLGLLLGGEVGLAQDAMISGNPTLQIAVIEAALQGKDTAVYDAVSANLGSLLPHLQLQALGALEFSGNRAYAKIIEPLLQNADQAVQHAASQALARIGTAASIPALMANGSPESRWALGLLDAEGVDQVLEAEAAKKGDNVSRSVAIDALAIRGRRDLIPTFFSYAEDEGMETVTAAVKAIGMIGDLSNLEQLTSLMIAQESSPVSRDILKAIVEIMRRSVEPAKAVDILTAQIGGASARSQANILQALVQTGSMEALAPVVEACKSDDENLQKLAVKLLSGWESDRALPAIIELAGDDSISLANHVTLMRGASRLLATKKKVNQTYAKQALEVCRRPEEKQMIQDLLDKNK